MHGLFDWLLDAISADNVDAINAATEVSENVLLTLISPLRKSYSFASVSNKDFFS
jgi:hypothetical protein